MGFQESTGLWPSDHLCGRTLGVQKFGADSVNETDRYYSIKFSTLGEARVQTRGKPKSLVGVCVCDHSCQGFMVSLVSSVSLKTLTTGARLKPSIQVMDVLLG